MRERSGIVRASWWLCVVIALGSVLASGPLAATAAEAAPKRILIVSGPSQHPPGTHESAAGARLLKSVLEHTESLGPVRVDLVTEWPSDKAMLDEVATVVFFGDLFPAETLSHPDQIKADLAKMMDRGCGITCLHYATGLQAKHVTADGDHPLLHWLGGYFATACTHHQSVARVVPATIKPEPGDHPILRGWKTFAFDDEPYWNNYFGKDGPAKNVTFLVSTMQPPEDPKKEIVGWAVSRADGGRGFALVMPHFYRNWLNDDLRTLILNGVCWTAKIDIPAGGIQTPKPDLAQFAPVAVEPPGSAKP